MAVAEHEQCAVVELTGNASRFLDIARSLHVATTLLFFVLFITLGYRAQLDAPMLSVVSAPAVALCGDRLHHEEMDLQQLC